MRTFHKSSAALCKKLSDLERMGRYDEAFSEVERIWTDRTKLPDVEHLEPHTAAEVILRCGSLIGFLGHQKQLPNSQEKSKNLLTEARSRFLEIYNVEKIAECENYMALAYWRAGELVEAEVWINEVFSHRISHSSLTMLHTLIIQSMIFISAKNYHKILEQLEPLEMIFLKYGDDSLKGSFYNNLGIAYECLGKVLLASAKLETGKKYHLNSGNKFQYAAAENNLAVLYKLQKKFKKSHEASDNATKIFQKLKDRTREGFSLDTKAQIYLAEKKYEKALETSEKAIEIIKTSENTSFITETYLTKTKTLICLNDISGATACLFEAVKLAKVQTGEKASESLIKEYEIALREKFEKDFPTKTMAEDDPVKNSEPNKKTEDNLELVLPSSIARYQNIQAVQIMNRHLEFAGLEKDSFAIVADLKLKKGDLAALVDLETDAVNCGFYDEDFGIICLETGNSDPMLFDVKNVAILGKIVGVGEPDKFSDGRIKVKSLPG